MLLKVNIKNYNDVKKQMYKSEDVLNKYAAKSEDAVRLKEEKKQDIRLEYAHDIDRIIHSLSYTRYIDKTQVYSNSHDDNISKRMTHVQFVSRTSQTIARALGLNEDLCEAISLGHDIGHVPFGHAGERILNKISKKYIGQVFAHNVQSMRNFMFVENRGKGLNLTIQTLDGMICHNGEFISDKYEPIKKDKDILLKEYNDCYKDEKYINALIPMTLEGCIVRISDIIGYIGKDIEDAIILGKFKREEIPDNIVKVLGNTNKDIMNSIILDIIENSFGKSYISMSNSVYEVLNELKKFNYVNIYDKSLTDIELLDMSNMFNKLFLYYLDILKLKNDGYYNCDIYKVFLKYMEEDYLKNTSNERIVIDYIAGMTDDYIKHVYKKNILIKGGR